jgi:hypothetical protein
MVSVALTSGDFEEKADVMEAVAIAVNDPERLALLIGEVPEEELATQTLEELLLAVSHLPNAQLPDALDAALVADQPEWGSKSSPLYVAMLAEREFGKSAPGRWQTSLALASSPLLRGASWEAIETMSSEVHQPAGNPRGLWITVEAGPHGSAGACLNPGWLRGESDTPKLSSNEVEVVELSTDWLGRLALLSPNLPFDWLANIRNTSKDRQELFA